ncbi:MAG: S1 RNA-binding domain-containing protein, partial [Maioricimonas sp. JB049]
MSTEHLPVEDQIPSQDEPRQPEVEKPAEVESPSQERAATPGAASGAPTPADAAPAAVPAEASPPPAEQPAASVPAEEPPAAAGAPAGDDAAPAEVPAASTAEESPEAGEPGGDQGSQPKEGLQPKGGDEGARRKLRLNPTVDPQAARAVPTIAEGAAAASQSQQQTPVSTGQSEAEIDARAEQLVEQASESQESAPETPAKEQVAIPSANEAAIDEEMESEIAAAMASGELEAAGAATPPAGEQADEGEEGRVDPTAAEELTEGTKLTGEVQSIHEDNVFLEFGLPMTGVVSLRQFGAKNQPKVGQKVKVVVNRVDDEEGLIVTSLPRGTARIAGDWTALSPGQAVDCTVTKTNKGGLEVSVGGLR